MCTICECLLLDDTMKKLTPELLEDENVLRLLPQKFVDGIKVNCVEEYLMEIDRNHPYLTDKFICRQCTLASRIKFAMSHKKSKILKNYF
uniref:Zf-AD domain-containing protein n=1 Tax=Parastrongyloides trichosuri TaxID=131310 RepID=A0A0N4Z7F8_PARTI